MTKRKHGFSLFHAADHYIDELLEAQERELAELRKEPQEQEDSLNEKQRAALRQENLTPKEKFMWIGGAVAAGLLIAGIFIVACFLFLLFCTKIWFA